MKKKFKKMEISSSATSCPKSVIDTFFRCQGKSFKDETQIWRRKDEKAKTCWIDPTLFAAHLLLHWSNLHF
jgi:hypothetical protein